MQDKIIFILQNCFWGIGGKTSGGDVRFGSIFSHIQKHFSNKSIIFSNRDGELFDKDYNLMFRFVKTPSFFDKFGIYLSYILRTVHIIYKLLILNRPIYFYSTSDFFPDVIPPFVLKKNNIKWIQHIFHIYLPPKIRKGSLFRNIIGYYTQRFSFFLIKKRADQIVLINNIVKEELIKLGFQEQRLIVSGCGVDFNYFRGIKKNQNGYDAIFLGRIAVNKGAIELIEIWKRVSAQLPQARLAIIGEGNEEIITEMRNRILDYNLNSHINLFGYLKNDIAFSLLKSSKVFLFPSHEEGWGIVIAEAMACSLPVIAWDLPIYRDIFDNHIIQVSEGDLAAFSNQIVELLKNDEKRKRFASSGLKFIKKYSWDNIANKELQIISGEGG